MAPDGTGAMLEVRSLELFRCVADGVFRATDGILHFAFRLLSGTFGFQLGVAGQFAGGFLDCAAGLFGRTGNAVIVHRVVLHCWGPDWNTWAITPFRARSPHRVIRASLLRARNRPAEPGTPGDPAS
jgi:hypothetical protein